MKRLLTVPALLFAFAANAFDDPWGWSYEEKRNPMTDEITASARHFHAKNGVFELRCVRPNSGFYDLTALFYHYGYDNRSWALLMRIGDAPAFRVGGRLTVSDKGRVGVYMGIKKQLPLLLNVPEGQSFLLSDSYGKHAIEASTNGLAEAVRKVVAVCGYENKETRRNKWRRRVNNWFGVGRLPEAETINPISPTGHFPEYQR